MIACLGPNPEFWFGYCGFFCAAIVRYQEIDWLLWADFDEKVGNLILTVIL